MDRSDDTINFNIHVKTGDAVTFDEAVKHEQEARATSAALITAQEKKKELSNTDTGAMIKQRLLNDVETVLVEQINQQRDNGGGKATWYLRKDFDKVKHSLIADMTLMVVLDGVTKELSLRSITENLGKHFSCLLFAAVVEGKASGRRMIARLNKQITERTKDTTRRADMVWHKAAKWGYDLSVWHENECVKVGHVLLNCVLKGTNLIEIVKEKRGKDNNLTRYVNFTDTAQKLIREHRDLLAEFNASLPPMIHPPRDWNADNVGPYLSTELQVYVKAVRNMSPDQEAEVAELKRNDQLDHLFEALNFIQSTPYTINTFILDALDWLYDERSKADVLKKFPDLIKAKRKERLPTADFKALSKEAQMDFSREYNFVTQYNSAVNANDACLNKRKGLARKLTAVERFWLPHNFDYRGRVYHIPDFGPHNSDHIRALFLFANGKPIGDAGDVLAIQVANRYGLDKKTLDERIEWVHKHSDIICKTGADFKASFPHWSKASEPLQYLAACREWMNYKEIGPSYVSGLPANLDATQSGIQHFAAASLNPKDGQKVNLTDNPVPHDFYKDCLNLAKNIIAEDEQRFAQELVDNPWTDEEKQTLADYEEFQSQEYPTDEHGHVLFDEGRELDEAKKESHKAFKRTDAYTKRQKERDLAAARAAIALGDEYDRSVIKRNAMTYSYSSRQFGFAEQLRTDWMNDFTKQVRQGKRDVHPFGKDRGYHAAFYLAGVHEKAIGRTVSSASDGMEFMQDIADIMSADASDKDLALDEKTLTNKRRLKKLSGRHVRFENRMGFPCYQYYRKGTSKSQKVFLWDRQSTVYDKENNQYYKKYSDTVEKDKSRQGIAPNTIHSQDGCHLLMTALALKDCNVESMMVIHDSFATTIADTAKLDEVLRRQFISLYTENDYCLFTEMLEQAKARHSDPDSVEWPKIPEKGDEDGNLLDLEEVARSKYFFN
jgi:DNA-directed RNA polymerase